MCHPQTLKERLGRDVAVTGQLLKTLDVCYLIVARNLFGRDTAIDLETQFLKGLESASR